MENIRTKNLWHLAVALLLCFSFMQAQQAQEITEDSKIKEVTLFPDRATIEREATLTLHPGAQKVILSGLPSSLIPDSIRVSGKGQAKVKILGVELKTEFLETAFQEEIQKLEKEIASVKQELSRLKEAIDIQLAKEKFLKSIGEGAFSQMGKEILSGTPDPLNLEKVLKFLEKNLDQAKTEKLSLENVRQEKEEKLKTLEKRLDSIKPERSRQTNQAEVLLEADSKVDFTLSMNYMVRNARWTPHYTLRALPEDSSIELTLAAEVQQKSGENWDSVKLNLSTSSPSSGTSPPQLPPWEVDIYEPQPVLRERKDARKAGAPLMAAAEVPMEAEEAVALIEESGLHLNFVVPRSVNIPGDGSEHQVPISVEVIQSDFDYFTVPKRNQAAFLRASLKNTLSYPLLPGKTNLFISQDFVGSGRIPFLSPQEETNFFFGEDQQIRVKYEQLKKKKIEPGFLSKTEKMEYAFRITIENFRRKPIEVEVLDQLPVSRNSKIEIKNVSLKPEPSQKEENGLLHWLLPLAPEERKQVMISFTVEYPKDSVIR